MAAGTVYAAMWIWLAVTNHQDHLQAEAQIPHYRSDCAHAARYSPAQANRPCYDIQTQIALTRHYGSKSHYDVATARLPNGKETAERLYSTGWGAQPPPSGVYMAQVWNSAVTTIVVQGHTLQTEANPVAKAYQTRGSQVFGPALVGAGAALFVIIGGVVFLRPRIQ